MGKLKVLQFITPAGFYGAERWILALAGNLNPEKVTCQLAVTRESEKQNLDVADRFRSLGLSSFQIPMRGRFDARGIWKLVNLIRREGVSLLHTHGYKSDIIGLLAARLSGIKVLATPHGFENAPDRKLQFFMKLGSCALRHMDCVAPLSEELKADVVRFKVNPARVSLIMNGVDLAEVEEERKKDPIPADNNNGERKIGYIGQIAHRKNIGDLLKVFDALYREEKNIRLILVGDGPQRRDLELRAKELPSGKKIEFLGYRNDRLRFLKEMDLFTMTSSLEGIPRCMMEAMAMGIPVAAYQIPGVDKLIRQEETGLMAPFGDIEGLKECWKRLLKDERFSAQVAQNGRRHVMDKFSAKRMAGEYTELYKEIVNKAHRS